LLEHQAGTIMAFGHVVMVALRSAGAMFSQLVIIISEKMLFAAEQYAFVINYSIQIL
jgi:hypothetical protein